MIFVDSLKIVDAESEEINNFTILILSYQRF
jgi:hypothetical protein